MDKVVNGKGEGLMKWIEREGRLILNGNKEGDEEGHWTYEKGGNKTVIDYGIVNTMAWEKIEIMKVGYRVESDHLPIEIWIKGREEKEERRKERKKVKWIQMWGEKEITEFRNKEKEIKWKKGEGEEEWLELKGELKDSEKKGKQEREEKRIEK